MLATAILEQTINEYIYFMNLYDLFLRCITIPYQQTGVSANYAFEIVDNVLYIYF